VKLENEFEVPVPVERAWPVLLDVERITPCLPGAALTEAKGDGEYAGTMKVKLGPIVSTYTGTIRIEEADETARRAVMRAQARDSRGQGSASATITSVMEGAGDTTRVRVETDMRVTGPAARMGRGVMQDVSAKLLTQFADCLAAEISREPAGVDLEGEPEAATATVTPGVPPTEPPPRGTPPAADVLDVGEASREAVLKRAVPVLAALLALLVALLALRRRR
jgi:carbon monoxide dehydrogenase subunit G